jgi:uncharacterized membrane protein YccF (DUF307 family)
VSLSRDNWLQELVLLLYCVVSGWLGAIFFAFFGIIACLLVVTTPFGIGAFRISGYLLWPFGRSLQRERPARPSKPGTVIGGFIWVLLFAWQILILQAVTGVILFCTIIGIPLALAHFEQFRLYLWPLGVRVIRSDTDRFSDML